MLIDHPEAKLNVKVLVPPIRLQSGGSNLTPGIVLVNSGTLATVVSILFIAKHRLDMWLPAHMQPRPQLSTFSTL
jgi:hypothetical protein